MHRHGNGKVLGSISRRIAQEGNMYPGEKEEFTYARMARHFPIKRLRKHCRRRLNSILSRGPRGRVPTEAV